MNSLPVRLSLPATRRHAAFTLVEVIGAFFLTTVVLFAVTGIFSENGRQRSAASEKLRVATTAAAALDLVAEDLEGAIFVRKPEGRDGRNHPWIFQADGESELGATRLRFQTQNVSRSRLGEHASTWVDVAYFLTEEESEESGIFTAARYTLWRWRSLRQPSDAARRFPDQNEPGAARVAEGLAGFGITFVGDEGEAADDWDSSLGTGDSPMPVAAEIRLSVFREARAGEAEPGSLQVPSRVHSRSISISMHRPIDVDALIAAANSSGGATCSTIADCADFDDQWFEDQRASDCEDDDELCDLLNSSNTTCWSEIKSGWSWLADQAAPECENLP